MNKEIKTYYKLNQKDKEELLAVLTGQTPNTPQDAPAQAQEKAKAKRSFLNNHWEPSKKDITIIRIIVCAVAAAAVALAVGLIVLLLHLGAFGRIVLILLAGALNIAALVSASDDLNQIATATGFVYVIFIICYIIFHVKNGFAMFDMPWRLFCPAVLFMPLLMLPVKYFAFHKLPASSFVTFLFIVLLPVSAFFSTHLIGMAGFILLCAASALCFFCYIMEEYL